jgi:3-dehydroquinate synthase
MAVSPVPESLVIQSHAGPYEAAFDEEALERLDAGPLDGLHLILDDRVADLHRARMPRLLAHASVLRLQAVEPAKSLERMPDYVGHLLARGVRRDHTLVAIGGGVIQDIACFLAANLLRGLAWRFLPTTLLAQADSSIGSKSSINCGAAKNILGTFTPPRLVQISSRFLDTLDERDLRSGVGEMLKVHAIAGPEAFDRLAADYDRLFTERAVMNRYIRASLAIKKPYIEEDEFDRGPRNIFNLGHSFGHAIEAATDFAVPHGIAVTIGVAMALDVARGLGLIGADHVQRMRPVLAANARGFETVPVPLAAFLVALAKDKKNVGQGSVTLILPDAQCRMVKRVVAVDDRFTALCREFFERGLQA